MKGVGLRKQHETDQREAHADGEREGLRSTVGLRSDHGLQQRSGDLKCESDQTDLSEREMIRFLQHRVHGRNERLQNVIEQMGEAQGQEHLERRFAAT